MYPFGKSAQRSTFFGFRFFLIGCIFIKGFKGRQGQSLVLNDLRVSVILNDSVPGVPKAEMTEYSRVPGVPKAEMIEYSRVPGVPKAEMTEY